MAVRPKQLRDAYRSENLAQGRRIAQEVLASFPNVPDPRPEIKRLGRTLKQWKAAFLAYFDTGRTSNGGNEAGNGLIELHRRIARGLPQTARPSWIATGGWRSGRHGFGRCGV